MKDMLTIIIRTILAIAAIFVIIIVFAVSTNSSEDKMEIRQDQERIVEYIKEKVELNDNEAIKKLNLKVMKKIFQLAIGVMMLF